MTVEGGKIIVITGRGKGKTTMALGLALKAATTKAVRIVQFKGNGYSGELWAAQQLAGLTIQQFGHACPHAAAIRAGLQGCLSCGECFHKNRATDNPFLPLAVACIENILRDSAVDMLVVDEVSYPFRRGSIPLRLLRDFQQAKENGKIVILTGRDMPEALLELADEAVECSCVKHPKDAAVPARRGIEY